MTSTDAAVTLPTTSNLKVRRKGSGPPFRRAAIPMGGQKSVIDDDETVAYLLNAKLTQTPILNKKHYFIFQC